VSFQVLTSKGVRFLGGLLYCTYIHMIVCIYVGISRKGWVSFFGGGGGLGFDDGWMVVLWMDLMEFFEGVDGWERGFGGMGWGGGGGDGWGWKLKSRCG